MEAYETLQEDYVAITSDKTLSGYIAIHPNIKHLTLIPAVGATIYYRYNATSSAGSALIPAGGIDLPARAAQAALWHVSGSGNLQVIQSGC